MSRLYHQTTISVTPVPLPEARKLANKQRRQAGREVSRKSHRNTSTSPSPGADTMNSLFIFSLQRHEERKVQLKDFAWDRRWEKRFEGNGQRQGKRRDDGSRAFVGRNLDNHRVAALRAHSIDTMGAAEEVDHQQHAQETEEERLVVPEATSGATLLAMARPAKSRRRRCPPAMQMTDGEAFEIVEVDGRLVALDEDGWEILPDENGEESLLYSDIVRGLAR